MISVQFNIPDGSTLYNKQLVAFVATIDAGTGNKLPTGKMLTISQAMGIQLGSHTTTLSVPVTVDTANPQKGTTAFSAVVDQNPRQIAFGVAFDQEAAVRHQFKSAPAVTVNTNGSTQQVITVAPDDNRTPADSQYTIQYTAEVTDDNGAPVPNYVIDWQQLIDLNLFNKTNIFTKDAKGATTKTSPMSNTPFRNGPFIRTITDTKGKATIYIVATTKEATAQLQVFDNGYDNTECSQFVIVDLQTETLGLFSPTPEGTIIGDALDLPSIHGPNVPVNIQPYQNAMDGDMIFVFFNKIYSSSFVWDNSVIPSYPASFPKVNAYTDIGPNAGKLNDLRYVVATNTGVLRTSESTAFKCIGSQGENKPLPNKVRNLPAPQVENAGDFVNADTITGGLNIDINLTSTLVNAQKDDTIIVNIYLNGFDNDGNEIHNKYQSPKTTLSPADITAGIKTIQFKDNLLFGYNSSPQEGYGKFYAEYTLTQKATGKTGLSKFVEKLLDTVAPGNI